MNPWEQLCQGLAEGSFLRLACDIAPRLLQGTATTFQLTVLAIGLGLVGGSSFSVGARLWEQADLLGEHGVCAICARHARVGPALSHLLWAADF